MDCTWDWETWDRDWNWYCNWDWDGGRSFAEYDVFRVDNQEDNYRLHVRGYHGNAGARMTQVADLCGK